ncbi:MAG: DUF2807 domain-containing protein [Pseudomonadota bacterium]
MLIRPAGALTLVVFGLLFAPVEVVAGETLVVRDFVGVFELRTGAYERVEVSVKPGEGVVARPEVKRKEHVVTVYGDKEKRVQCRDRDTPQLRVQKGKWRDLSDFPHIIATAPKNVVVKVESYAAYVSIGEAANVTLKMNGCGHAEILDVASDFYMKANGSGDVVAHDIGGFAKLSLNGSSDVEMGRVGGGLTVEINGSGDVKARKVMGPIDIGVRGSGDVDIEEGRASSFDVSIMGAGDITFGGLAMDPSIAIFGSGDIRVREAKGDVRRTRFGSGDIEIGP